VYTGQQANQQVEIDVVEQEGLTTGLFAPGGWSDCNAQRPRHGNCFRPTKPQGHFAEKLDVDRLRVQRNNPVV
jgi:hypothetical protein